MELDDNPHRFDRDLMRTHEYNSDEASAASTCKPEDCEARRMLEGIYFGDVEPNFSARDCEAVRFEAKIRFRRMGQTSCGLLVRLLINAHDKGEL